MVSYEWQQNNPNRASTQTLFGHDWGGGGEDTNRKFGIFFLFSQTQKSIRIPKNLDITSQQN